MTTVSDTEIFRLANDALGKLDIDFSGYSGGGIHVVGGRDSIIAVDNAVHAAGTIPHLQSTISDLIKIMKETQAEVVRLKNELTAMEMAAKSRMDLDAMVRKYGISHVLIGLECIAHEEAIIRRQNNEPRAVADHWRILGDMLGRFARNNSDMEVST